MKLNNILTGILVVCILCGIVTAATTISDTSISVDNLILGGQTIVAYTAALNTKLSGIEVLADVTDATNVNAAGAVMESDIPNQSFTNILKNGDFESWSAGTAVAPDGWNTLGGVYTIAKESSIIKKGTYSAKLTRSSGATPYLYQDTPNYLQMKNITVTLGAWLYASAADKAYLSISDGINSDISVHSGDSTWQFKTVTITIDNGAISYLRSSLYVLGTGGVGYIDSAILVEGLVCPASSPKPLVDDGIMLQSHTPSSASDYGVIDQWCYDDNYIYVCNATDTWIRTSLTTW